MSGPAEIVERALAGLVLLAAAAPAARLVARPSFRRAFPRSAAGIAAAILAYAGVVVVAVAAIPATPLRVLVGLALLGLLAAAVAARPGRGSARGWPPGSLGIFDSFDLLADPDGYRKRAAAHGPVFKARQYRHRVACVVGLERGISALRDHDDDLSVPPLPFDRLVPGRFLRYMDREAHRAQKAILAEALSDKVVERCEPFLVARTRRALAEMAAASRSEPRGLAPRESLRRLVHAQFARLFFGVESDSPEGERLERLYRRVDPFTTSRRGLARERRATREIRTLVEEKVEAWSRGERPPPDCFLGALLEGRPEAARNPTTIANLVFLLATSSGDVSGLLAWILALLGANPAWVERLRRDPAPESLARRIVLETLRLEQSEFLYRRAERPIRIGGRTIPAGWLVRICVRESHRDPARFPDPDRFDPDRFAQCAPRPGSYSPFGALRHLCLGRELTLAVGRAFVEELAGGYDWSVVADGPREIGRRHWNHWRPSGRLRIRLEPRADGARASVA